VSFLPEQFGFEIGDDAIQILQYSLPSSAAMDEIANPTIVRFRRGFSIVMSPSRYAHDQLTSVFRESIQEGMAIRQNQTDGFEHGHDAEIQ
jgi:hypothetical protein